MKLVVHELNPSVYQKITATDNIIVAAIRPHIYRHNFATGTLKVQLQTTDGDTIAESNEVNISDIGTQLYYHGYVRFDIDAYLKANTEYRVNVVAGGGYSFSESAYCGVCTDFDLRKYDATYSPNTGLDAALDLEIWERKP